VIKAFIIAQPKAGTTHMTFSLRRYFNGEYGSVNLWANRGIEVQDIHPATMLELINSHTDFIVKPHLQATPNNINALQHFNIRPIIMTRNIFDSVISMRDHFDKDVNEGTTGMVPMPLGFPFYHDSYRALSPQERIDYIIDYIAPWLIMFQYGWQRYQGECLRIDYDSFMKNKRRTFAHTIQFLEGRQHAISKKRIQASLKHEDIRYNSVISGRGLRELNAAQQARIIEMQNRLSRV